jgi:hypothetical protein
LKEGINGGSGGKRIFHEFEHKNQSAFCLAIREKRDMLVALFGFASVG